MQQQALFDIGQTPATGTTKKSHCAEEQILLKRKELPVHGRYHVFFTIYFQNIKNTGNVGYLLKQDF